MHGLLSIALVLAFPMAARADAYAWGGTRGRVSVHVELSGFNDGAGGGGWDLANARWFAAWAARLEAMLPAGTSVAIENTEPDGELVLRVTHAYHMETIPLGIARAFPGTELDAVLAVLAHRFRVAVPPERAAPLYTVQLLAAADADRATAFAHALEERAIDVTHDVFWEACRPCGVHAAHVLPPGPGGLHRVVVGLHADRHAAREALRALRALGLRGFVRAL